MKKFVFACILSASMFQTAKAWSWSGNATVGSIQHSFVGGKLNSAYFRLYDYVGGSYKGEISIQHSSSTGSILANEDTKKGYELLSDVYENCNKVTYFYNVQRVDGNWRTGNTVHLVTIPW